MRIDERIAHMKIELTIDEKFLAEAIEEFCFNHLCPSDCIFDKIGICTDNNPFNTILVRIRQYKRDNS